MPEEDENEGTSSEKPKPPSINPSFDPTTHSNKTEPLNQQRTKSAPNSPYPISVPNTPYPSSIPNTPNPTSSRPPSRAPSRASSVASESSHKFNLKDLLGSTPKLTRRLSQRSAGSRKSDKSDDDEERSTKGSDKGSLSAKYGRCQKIAIGKGATSVVRLAHKWEREGEEKLYAVKEFRPRRRTETEKEYIKKLTAEFCISSTLHHVNVVETVDLVQDENSRWCEVMEFCPGGDLYAAIRRGSMSPAEVECCFKQILRGVSYLHSQGVAHRDIKPENLFFDAKGCLKIGDYGASTVYRLPWEATIHMSTGLCGSEPYIAPEQFLGKPYDARLVDIWACGIVYYCLHFQELPWRAAQMSDSLYAAYANACATANPPSTPHTHTNGHTHRGEAPPATFPPTITNLSPRACRPLLRKMLEPNPKLRWTIEEIMGPQGYSKEGKEGKDKKEKEKEKDGKLPGDKWIAGIEICWEAEALKRDSGGKGKGAGHVHVNARSVAESLGLGVA